MVSRAGFLAALPPLVLAVAPTGARKTKVEHRGLPITPDELAETAALALEAGASLFHLHVRDAAGKHTLDAAAYRDAIAAIRGTVGERIVIQATSEAVGIYSPDQQIAMVRDVRPEAVSLALREIVPDASREKAAHDFFRWMIRERIAPQIIVYEPAELTRLQQLRERDVLPGATISVLFVLGRYAADQRSAPADLLPFLAADRGRDAWMMCAFGELEAACGLIAATLGGHVRIGFENNVHLASGMLASDNGALLRQFATAAPIAGRRLATADEARAILYPEP